MPMSLRLRCVIARLKHRAAYLSVETETKCGPATSRPEQRAKNHQPASVSRRATPSRFSQEIRLAHSSDQKRVLR
jgi:hypothetical protein